jgi:hypothetical protein
LEELIISSVREYPQLKPLMTRLIDDRNKRHDGKSRASCKRPKAISSPSALLTL